MDKERIVQVLSWHQIQTDEQLGKALRQVKEAGLIPEEKVRLGIIGDGAQWIWNQARELYPSAVQILDSYHLSERLHRVALAQFYDDPLQERGMGGSHQSQAVLWLSRLGAVGPGDDEAQG